jgi:hypothetical protein
MKRMLIQYTSHSFFSFCSTLGPYFHSFRFLVILYLNMRYTALFAVVTSALASTAAAIGVIGAAEGFAKGVTGGGSANPVYPTTTDELVSYLGDSEARVIILAKTYIHLPPSLQVDDRIRYANNELLVSTSAALKGLPPLPAAPPGAPALSASSLLTRTLGATTSPVLLRPGLAMIMLVSVVSL